MVFAVVCSHLVDLLLWSRSCLVTIFALWHLLGYFLSGSQNHHVWSPLTMCARYFPALILGLLYFPVIYFLVGRVFRFRLKHLVLHTWGALALPFSTYDVVSAKKNLWCDLHLDGCVRLRERWHQNGVSQKAITGTSHRRRHWSDFVALGFSWRDDRMNRGRRRRL
jgi:hypothetical protein